MEGFFGYSWDVCSKLLGHTQYHQEWGNEHLLISELNSSFCEA